MNRILALFEVICVALLGSFVAQAGFSFYGLAPQEILGDTRMLFGFLVTEASITLCVIGSFLWIRGEGFQKIGWDWQRWPREVKAGLGAVPLLFGTTFLVGAFFRVLLPGYVSTTNPLLEMVRTPLDLALFVASSAYVGGVKEEIQRAFVLVRFEEHLGGIFLGLALWSVFFALGHQMQGVDSALGAGVLGLLFGLLYLWRRNLIAPMVSHALFDIITLAVFWQLFS